MVVKHKTNVTGVVRLADANSAQFGGKAKGLAQLSEMGLSVPEGYCVDESWRSYRDEVAAAYHALNAETVAVRSSASNEDGIQYSAAGQFESVLDVKGVDALYAAIETCISSGHNERVEAYFSRGLSQESSAPKMNVVVQKMVRAKVSGVLFTVEPYGVKGNSASCVVEACVGAGEQLVSGKVQAERFVVDRDTGALLCDLPMDAILSPGQIGRLVGEALRAEDELGGPLDLEWAFDEDGHLFWLQARPITTLLSEGPNELDDIIEGENLFYTRTNIGEMMPGASTPLTIDVFGNALNHGFIGLYGSCGALPKTREECQFIGSFYNHLFIDLTMLTAIVGRVAGTSQEALEVSFFGRELDVKPPVSWIHPVRRGVNFLRYARYVTGHKRAIRRMEKLRDTVHIVNGSDALSQYSAIDAFLSAYYQITTLHLQVSSFSGALNGAMREILRKGGLSNDTQMEVIASLLLNIEGIESAEIIRSLEEIAAVAKDEMGTAKTSMQFAAWLMDESSSAKAPALFRAFLAKNGHRCVREAELYEKEWRDDVQELALNLWNLARLEKPRKLRIGDVKASNDWRHALSAHCRKYPRVNRRVLQSVARRARDAVRYREYTKSIMIQMASRLRHAYRMLGKMLATDGMLKNEDHVFFFRHEELAQLLDAEVTPAEMTDKAIARKHWYRVHSNFRFADFCIGKPEPQQISVVVDTADSFAGLPVSPGKVTAQIRVVHSKDDARQLQEGEIMCARFTDVGWTPYYGVISGLITEIGSSLSHGAVVAREYQLPLVSSIEGATHIFQDGDVVELDGTQGRVRLLERKCCA